MFELLDLDQLGDRIAQVDQALVGLMARRMVLSLQVEEYKRGRGQKISRPAVETARLNKLSELAERLGLNPEFARAVFYFIIDESCKVQLIQLQEHADSNNEYIDDALWHTLLKENLLKLTAQCAATYDLQYASGFYATKLHALFEHRMLDKISQQYPKNGLALDLGCATGRIAFALGHYFDRVAGYDISPHMIEIARNKSSKAAFPEKFAFEVADLEEGIPLPDASASLVVMSLGFASDLQALSKVLREVHRVLIQGGTALLSFYNAEALLYQWEFMAWPVGLAAEINRQKRCLDVHWTDGKIYSVYARPYSVDQIHDLMPRGLPITQITTHPTICSILPDVLFKNDVVNASMATLDEKLADGNMGAYITAIAKKT